MTTIVLYKQWLCQKCGLTIEEHTNSCEIPVIYECLKCEKAFKSFVLLKNHQTCHSETKYECDVCGNKFKRKADEKRHRNIHKQTVLVFQCSYCEKQFRQSFI